MRKKYSLSLKRSEDFQSYFTKEKKKKKISRHYPVYQAKEYVSLGSVPSYMGLGWWTKVLGGIKSRLREHTHVLISLATLQEAKQSQLNAAGHDTYSSRTSVVLFLELMIKHKTPLYFPYTDHLQ